MQVRVTQALRSKLHYKFHNFTGILLVFCIIPSLAYFLYPGCENTAERSPGTPNSLSNCRGDGLTHVPPSTARDELSVGELCL
ncbi:hypothetical protein SFRURICE_012513 [Spodoptera frugiperda]|nr:hypothetical protein SFRURICE_012513 [Spodoptera frugiperda]